MNIHGIDLRRATQHLQASGVDITDRQLRSQLVERGAIRKSLFGYEVTADFRYSGLLITQTREHTITSECGRSINRPYTVVLVTGDGLSWLRDLLAADARKQAGRRAT